MAHSPFLQEMARVHNIKLNSPRRDNKLLVCRCVLEHLERIFERGPDFALPGMRRTEKYLRSVSKEFQIMRDEKELDFFWRSKYIKSVRGIERNMQAACNHAYAAIKAYGDQNDSSAAEYSEKCHHAIKSVIGEINIPH